MTDSTDAPRGALTWYKGRPRLRVRLGSFGRRMLTLTTCRTQAEAEKRRDVLVPLAARLAASGQAAIGFPLLQAVATREGALLDAAIKALEHVVKGETREKSTGETTVRKIAERWTSGELARSYPDHVRAKRSGDEDAGLFERYILPLVGEVPIARFTLDHGMAVMKRIPSDRAPATRRHVAQAMRRLMSYAVFPLRLRPDNPLDAPNFLPRLGRRKLKCYVYPSEDRVLLGCTEVPLKFRVLYAFLAREGMRASEAAGLTWGDLDLERGLVTLVKNKTDDVRAWPLREDVARAFVTLRKLEGGPSDARPVFAAHPQPKHLRKHLEVAGLTRGVLFKGDATHQPIRVHDLRAAFVTVALANGKTEDWVMRRTGHKSSVQVQLYRRGAQNAADVNLGDFAPMDAAIPELRSGSSEPSSSDGDTGHNEGNAPRDTSRQGTTESQSPEKRSDSRRAESQDCHFESSNRGSNPRTGTTPVTPRNGSENGGSPDATNEGGAMPGYPAVTRGAASAHGEGGSREAAVLTVDAEVVDVRAEVVGVRAEAVRRLAGELAALAAAGDLEGAAVLNEAMGRLLAPPTRRSAGSTATVIDLEAERVRRAVR